MKKMIFTLYWYLNFPSLRSTWVFPFSSSGSFSLHPICARYIISLARCFVFLFVICLPRRRRPVCRAAELFHLRAQDFLVFVLDAAGFVILLPFSISVPSSSRVDSCSRSHRACQIPAPEVANQGCSLCRLVSLSICAPVLSRQPLLLLFCALRDFRVGLRFSISSQVRDLFLARVFSATALVGSDFSGRAKVLVVFCRASRFLF
jgi:hypothetical protein